MIRQALDVHKQGLDWLQAQEALVTKTASLFVETLSSGGKIIAMGNGGSACDAQHLAAELVGRFKKQRKGLAAIALTADAAILTAVGNDFGFEEVFARQVEALARPGDLVVGISTSGTSANVVNAIKKARATGVKTVGLLGNTGGTLIGLVDCALVVPVADTPRIQEIHALIIHIICAYIDEHFSRSFS